MVRSDPKGSIDEEITHDGGHVVMVHRVYLDIFHIYQRPDHIPQEHPIYQPPCPSYLSFFSSLRNPTTHPVLTEMIKLQNPIPSSLRVPIQNAQSDTSLLAVGFLDDDRYDVDVSGFSQVLDPDWVGGSGAARSNSIALSSPLL